MTLITNANLENDEPRRHAQEIHPVFFLVRWISSASRRQVVPLHDSISAATFSNKSPILFFLSPPYGDFGLK